MNLDDESLLSAYLDDELDPARRLLVESALLTDAPLAERLQQLAAVRSFLARQPRPVAGVDFSGPILARLEMAPTVRLRRALRGPAARSRIARVGSVLASAAALLMLVAGPLGPRPMAPPRPIGAGDGPASIPVATTDDAGAQAEGPVISAPGQAKADLAATVGTPTSAEAPEIVPADRAGVDASELDAIRRSLGRDDLRRLLVVLDRIDTQSLAEVEGAIQATSRANPILGAIRIAQGIEVDPAHPHEAVVYVVVLQDQEYQYLRDNLRRHALPVEEDEGPVHPAVVTQLADIGLVDITRGPHSTPLGPAPELKYATRIPDEAATAAIPATGPTTPDSRPDRTPAPSEGTHSAVIAGTTNAPSRSPGDNLRPRRGPDPDREGGPPGGGTIYLVWVTTRNPERPTPL